MLQPSAFRPWGGKDTSLANAPSALSKPPNWRSLAGVRIGFDASYLQVHGGSGSQITHLSLIPTGGHNSEISTQLFSQRPTGTTTTTPAPFVLLTAIETFLTFRQPEVHLAQVPPKCHIGGGALVFGVYESAAQLDWTATRSEVGALRRPDAWLELR